MDEEYGDEVKKKKFDHETLVVQDVMKTEGGRCCMLKHLQDCGVF